MIISLRLPMTTPTFDLGTQSTTTISDKIQSLLKAPNSNKDPGNSTSDKNWIRQSFLTTSSTNANDPSPSATLDPIDAANRSFSSAHLKFSDSSLGGNSYINPIPQFTPYADTHVAGMNKAVKPTTVNYNPASGGRGIYHTEAFDDNAQVIHIRFGVPSYNSMIQFFTGFYSHSAATLARSGRVDTSFLEKFLNAGATLITLSIMPLAILPMALSFIGTAFRYCMKMPASTFYYLKPAMPAYWNAVQSLINQIGVNKGIINYISERDTTTFVNDKINLDNADYQLMSALFPEMSSKGLLNIYAIANKCKRMENRFNAVLLNSLVSDDKEWYGKVKKVIDDDNAITSVQPYENTQFALETYWTKWLDSDLGKMSEGQSQVELDMRKGPDITKLTPEQAAAASAQDFNAAADPQKFMSFFISEESDGSDWVSFRVDYSGTASESFSNSVGESALAQKLNSASASARNMRIDMANGDVLPGMETLIGVATNIVGSVMDTLHISGLMAIAGNAFVDIPKHYESSSASLNKTTYTVSLRSPYNNTISQFLFVDVPLAMLLAGCLPLATGKQSYTSPFLCELYDRGRCMTRLGIIDSLSIQRGVGNTGFTNDGKALGIDVSFSILDLSSIVSMPIQQGFLPNIFEGIFDTENKWTDYLMTLSGSELRDTGAARWPLLKHQIQKKVADVDAFFSMAHFAQYIASRPGINILSAITRGTTLK